ncbi:hypothetical protein FOE78_15570 [Microlunatus elymi]|uniref:Uncharacterized protein n=1 Tax=Microlunatus elymi TaxID=2596828 RepID=A0A516Q165_9ACTN|nr:hypothetical protein [Microlunatus elymi]QDP97156.1 hypothetical protein FOE78_15570 [Microlunatus elymi]
MLTVEKTADRIKQLFDVSPGVSLTGAAAGRLSEELSVASVVIVTAASPVAEELSEGRCRADNE